MRKSCGTCTYTRVFFWWQHKKQSTWNFKRGDIQDPTFEGTRQFSTIWFVYQFQKYSSKACQITHILKFFGLRQKFDASGFFFKIQNFMWEKIVAGVINGLSINKNFDEIFFPKFQNFHVKNGSSVKWIFFLKHYLPIVSWKWNYHHNLENY